MSVIRASAATAIHRDIGDTTTTVDVRAVEVLAPPDEAIIRVITCAGDWDPVARSYDRRLNRSAGEILMGGVVCLVPTLVRCGGE